MPPSRDRLDRIARLRALFLDDERGAAALADYWRDDGDLAAYAEVLAMRIGWKWDAALAECKDRGLPRCEELTVVDFGCGTGIAAQRFVAAFGAREVLCHDRSPAAMEFAATALRAAHPRVAARACPSLHGVESFVLLVSHVLGELDDRGRSALLELARRAHIVVVVEAGNRATSRRLGELRAELLPQFEIVAPCPHAGACPALASSTDWCHFFAPPPPHVFTDGDWVRTAKSVGIDLRSLPYAFAAFVRAPAPTRPAPPPHRVLGRAAVDKHAATLQLCTGTGLTEIAVQKRSQQGLWRELKRHPEGLRKLPETGL